MKKRRTQSIALITLTAMLIFGALSLFSTAHRLSVTEQKSARLREEIAAAETENERLLALISESGSDKAMEALARERFGLVKPGE